MPQAPTSSATLTDFQEGVAAVVELDSAPDAYAWLKIIRRVLANPQQYSQDPAFSVFTQHQWILAWVCLPMLGVADALELLQSHVREAIELGIPIAEKVRATLATVLLHDERDEWKQKMRDALLSNSEPLSSAVRHPQGQRLTDVGSWLKFYFRATVDQPSVAKAQFWNTAIVTNLSEPERMALRKIVTLFELLFRSSLTAEGVEEPIVLEDEKGHRVMRQGLIERISIDRRVQTALDALTDEQLGPGASDVHFVTRAFHGGLMVGSDLEEEEWEAARLLATELGQSERFSYERRRDRLTVDDVLLTLRAWFERKQGLSGQEAIRRALLVARASKAFGYPEFMDIAYYDESMKKFFWKELGAYGEQRATSGAGT